MASAPAERQLILLSAGTAARRAEFGERARRLTEEVDWGRLAQTLAMRRLLPTLGPRVVELAEGQATDDFTAAVDQAVEAAGRHGTFLQLVTLRAMAMLKDAGIPSSALKGPLFGEAVYGDCGRRPSTDIDLLVAPEHIQQAVAVVRELGYGPPDDHIYEDGLPLLHLVLGHERRELPAVEIHWRIHWYEQSFARDRLLPPDGVAGDGWRPAAIDELAALLLFYARDGFVDLRLASDLSAWWDACGADLGQGSLVKLMDDYPALARVLLASTMVAEEIVGLPGSKILGGLAKLGSRERVAVRLANPHPNMSRAQLYADIGLIDGLLAPPGGFRPFVRRNMFPPREVLDQQARGAERGRSRSALGRGAGIVGRYALTMTRLLRAPETLS